MPSLAGPVHAPRSLVRTRARARFTAFVEVEVPRLVDELAAV